MELYAGLDVSLKETSICVVDGKGEIVSEGTVISEPAAIAEFIKAVCLETPLRAKQTRRGAEKHRKPRRQPRS